MSKPMAIRLEKAYGKHPVTALTRASAVDLHLGFGLPEPARTTQ